MGSGSGKTSKSIKWDYPDGWMLVPVMDDYAEFMWVKVKPDES